MKKILLAGTALAGLVLAAAPAKAEGLKLDLGGLFRGYAVYLDGDETDTAGAGDELRQFDLRRDSEVHFTGETTLDNGLTVGVHAETDLVGAVATDETYAYFSGNWGRVNFGSEDGAAYLLQVAAPSADSNVDGLRVNISSFSAAAFDTDVTDATIANETLLLNSFSYDQADFSSTDRLTYLTPKFSGFQAGVSYAQEDGQNVVGNNTSGPQTNDDNDGFEKLWEAAARWDGEFQGVGLSAGAGYSSASDENTGAGAITDDLDTWNLGLGGTFGGFSLGGIYTESNRGLAASNDVKTWVLGGAWDNGPYHVGASYADSTVETAGAADLEGVRYAVGGGYTFGPGMTFRGSVAVLDTDSNGVNANDAKQTQVAVGTDIQF
jgi:hypothetical protein